MSFVQKLEDPRSSANGAARPRIVFDGVQIIYRPEALPPVLAVEHVDLIVADGELVSIVGPSGCGKTSLLKALVGLL